MDQERGGYVLLISSVGGTAEPLAFSVVAVRPRSVVFVPTPQTRATIATVIERAAANGVAIDPGQWRVAEVSDGQDFTKCVEEMRRYLDPEVRQWIERGADYRVCVDFTGGTKCMSAALALVAQRWPCDFVYIGGSARTKGGLGVVVDGQEEVVTRQNPWDALGYQAVDEAITLFNRHTYAGACQTLSAARDRMSPAMKRTLSTLLQVAEAYDAWDRFDHKTAQGRLGSALANANDLRVLLGPAADALLAQIEAHRRWLESLGPATEGSYPKVLDLIANADRRAEQGRYDDAVARLYRAIEAIAQLALKRHGIEHTAAVPIEALPAALRDAWQPRAVEGPISLGLQDDYAVLAALDDPLGRRFDELGLANRKGSPLSSRNQSILAHGFEAVRKDVFARLKKAAMTLAEAGEGDLPVFPKLRPLGEVAPSGGA